MGKQCEMSKCEAESCSLCDTLHQSVFCVLNRTDLDDLNANRVTQDVGRQEYLFHEGSFPRGLFCVYNGKFKVVKKNHEGKDQILHLAKGGDILGYRALINDEKYNCSAIAIEDCQVCFIPKQEFLSLTGKSPALAMRIMKLLASELRHAENRITDYSTYPSVARIAQALLTLKEYFGLRADQCTIDVSLSREELGSLAGLTRETVIRGLAALCDKKAIELKGKLIIVLNMKKLQDEAVADH
jgi:CRP/FNR family transcriptional regulator